MNDLSGLNLHPGGFGSSNKPEKRRGKKAEESMEHNSIAPSTGTIYFILKKYWKCSCFLCSLRAWSSLPASVLQYPFLHHKVSFLSQGYSLLNLSVLPVLWHAPPQHADFGPKGSSDPHFHTLCSSYCLQSQRVWESNTHTHAIIHYFHSSS